MIRKILSVTIAMLCIAGTSQKFNAATVSDFNQTITNPNATTSVGSTRPTTLLKADQNMIDPLSIPIGGYAEFVTTVVINGPASYWDVTGNRLSVGFIYENGVNNVLAASQTTAPLYHFQNNTNATVDGNTGGIGVFGDTDFLDANGNFIFGADGGWGGYALDSSSQLYSTVGSQTKFTIRLYATGDAEYWVQYLDLDLEEITNPASIQQHFAADTFDTSQLLSPVIGFRMGNNSPAGGSISISNSSFGVYAVPEPSRAMLLLVGIVGFTLRRRR